MGWRGGFTVIELVATIGLAAVLGGAAVMRLVALVDGARLAGGVRTVATALRVARGRAIAAGGAIEVRFDTTRRLCETRANGTTLEVATLPRGIGFVALPARMRIAFGALGTAENGTITLGAGSRQRSVIVNQRGRVRLS